VAAAAAGAAAAASAAASPPCARKAADAARVDAVAFELFRCERRDEALASVLAAGVNDVPARGWHKEIVPRPANKSFGQDVCYWTPNGRGGEKPAPAGVLRSMKVCVQR